MQATYLAMERMSKDNGGKVCHAWTFFKIVIFCCSCFCYCCSYCHATNEQREWRHGGSLIILEIVIVGVVVVVVIAVDTCTDGMEAMWF